MLSKRCGPREPEVAAAEAPSAASDVVVPASRAAATLADFSFRRPGRVPVERLDRAAGLGLAWGCFSRGEAGMPTATESAGVTNAVWVVLRPSRGSFDEHASVHNHKGGLEDDDLGYWSRVAVATAWSPSGVACRTAIFAGFGSMEEAYTYLEAAVCSPDEVFDRRARGSSAASP